MTTINRRLRVAFNKVLLPYGIDDLKLEIDLTSAVKSALSDLLPDETEAAGTFAALEAHEAKEHTVDTSEFPEEVANIIRIVCERWMLTPPMREKKKGGEYARWIECARSLKDACAEISVEKILHRVHTDYAMKSAENNGTAPYTVSGPCALIKVCRAKAGQLRGETHDATARNDGETESSFHF